MRINISFLLGVFIFLISCSPKQKSDLSTFHTEILNEIDQGNFLKADSLINLVLKENISDSAKTFYLNKKEWMQRVKLDFKRDENYIKEKLSEYYPELTEEQLREWEENKSLEMKIIDGQRRYFNWAHKNLFRVNAEARKRIVVDNKQSNGITGFYEDFVPKMISGLSKDQRTTTRAYKFRINYELTVDSGVVKSGDTLRAWLPFPKPNKSRQYDIELLQTNIPEYVLSPDTCSHRSIYFEKIVEDAGEQSFNIEYNVSTRGEWYGHRIDEIKPYKKNSELYKKYTNQRNPHIEFSEQIKTLADSIVGDKTNPYEVVQAIYSWIDEEIPWASAREYSTILNIPAYAIENGHGDCGIQTLLFITMARYKGVPAKWQSGWILIPGEVGLHDWGEVYFEGLGWVPVDQSYGRINSEDEQVRYFYTCGFDPYRLIVNDDFSMPFFPEKKFIRSETVDFQRGEVETQNKNLYFNEWSYKMTVKPAEN